MNLEDQLGLPEERGMPELAHNASGSATKTTVRATKRPWRFKVRRNFLKVRTEWTVIDPHKPSGRSSVGVGLPFLQHPKITSDCPRRKKMVRTGYSIDLSKVRQSKHGNYKAVFSLCSTVK